MPPPADPLTPDRPSGAAYLVLGMHRSGTSAVTQLLALAGARLPDQVMPGDEHNAKGYFEPWRIAVFNDRRLRAGGGAWDDPFSRDYQVLPDEADWRAAAADLFGQEFAGSPNPLLKDPRVSLLLPLWRPVIRDAGLTARCVIPVRAPLAVAGSLSRRDRFPAEKSVLLWMAYMLAAEAGSRDLPRAFVSYDALLQDWRRETAAIEAAHGASLPDLNPAAAADIDAFLTPELRHNDDPGALASLPGIGPAAQGLYDWFTMAAAGGSPDPAPLLAAEALLAEMSQRMRAYVSPVTRDLDQARLDLAEESERRRLREVEIALAEALLDQALAQD